MPGQNLPPLREIIWRRLRRRNAQLDIIEDEIGATTGQRERSRHREMLSWMVNQLTIDQQQQQQQPQNQTSGQPQQSSDQQPTPTDPLSPQGSENRGRSSSPLSNRLASSANDPGARYRILHRMRDSDGAGIPPAGPQANIGGYHGGFMPFTRRENLFGGHSMPYTLTHRIQAWNFVRGNLPDISDATSNVIVKEAKIHNDASVDITADGTTLITLIPASVQMTATIGVYSLSPGNRGHCYASLSVDCPAVSVSLSPTSRHILVGLTLSPRPSRISDPCLMAQIFSLKMPKTGSNENGEIIHRRDIPHAEAPNTHLNCIRWIPVPGQGIVYATNTGLLKILR